MFEKKNNKDALGNDLNNDNSLKVKSSKDEFEDKGEFSDNSKENMQALTVKYNEIDVTKHLKPIYYYECENCKKIHRTQIDVCPDCGSRFLKPLYTGMKYCYIDNANKRLTPRYNQILANQRKHEYGTNQSLVGDLILAFCIIMCFVALIGSQVIISKFTNDFSSGVKAHQEPTHSLNSHVSSSNSGLIMCSNAVSDNVHIFQTIEPDSFVKF